MLVAARVHRGASASLLVVAVTGAPGWDRVQESFFDPQVAREALPAVLRGLWLNVRLLVFCAIGALALGPADRVRCARCAARCSSRCGRWRPAYTYVFRGMPLIIVLYLFTFGVPGLRLQGTPSVLVLGGAALIVTYGAYLAEVFRAGIESVHPSQRRGGPLARADLPADDAARGAAAGGPPGGAAAAQRHWWRCRRTSGWSRWPARSTRSGRRRSQTAQTLNFTPYVVAGVLFVLLAMPLIAVTDWVTLRAARRQSAEDA